MKIYLARHGESHTLGIDDERSLNEKGKADIQHIANFMVPLKLDVSRIWQSPKFRAQQTAAILSSSFQVANGIETRDALDPMALISDILDEIYALNEDILLVGHMPFMGKLAAHLLVGNESKDIILFKTGSILCLENVGNTQWVIRWMLNPELCSGQVI